MEIIFINDKTTETEDNVSYLITDKNETDIGTSEGFGNERGIFSCVIKIYNPDFQQKGIGFEAFKKVYKAINRTFPISVIQASWHNGGEFRSFENKMSTNLLIFRKNATKLKERENVFSTPTGKWAQKIGFNNYKLISDNIDEVVVHFSK